MPRRISVKSASDVAQKWADVTAQKSGYYEAEAPAAGAAWEANTIAAKANDSIIARDVVEIKTGVDRIKEQAQNVE